MKIYGKYFLLFRLFALCGLAFCLIPQQNVLIYAVGQAILGLCIFQWFVLFHDFAHGSFFRSELGNQICGLMASMICLVPFFQWKYMHKAHHEWLGNSEKDPTFMPAKTRNFLPTYILRYSLRNFWNLKRNFALFPDWSVRIKFILSLVFMQLFFFIVRPLIPHFWLYWLPGYLIFLFVVDRLIYSQQELNINYIQKIVKNDQLRNWLQKYLLLNFNLHIEHQLHPDRPCFSISENSD